MRAGNPHPVAAYCSVPPTGQSNMNEDTSTPTPLPPVSRQRLERSLQRRWGPLRFSGRIEKTYREHYRLHWRFQTIISMLFGMLLYAAFGFLDFWLFPEQLFYLWVVRYGVTLPLAIAFLLTCWRATRDWQVQLAYAAFTVVGGASVTAMMLKLPNDEAHLYLTGIVLVIAFGYVVATLRPWYAMSAGILISALHLASEIWLRGAQPETLHSDIFFLGGINLIGAYGSLILDMEARRDFAHSMLLEQDRRRLASANVELADLSSPDNLTGVANRRTLERFLEDAWVNAEAASLPISALMLDLDHFKRFNDAHGQEAGDRCLHDVATHILPLVRHPTDLVARYGGEEFVVVLPGTDHEDALEIADRIRGMVEALPIPASGEDGPLYVSASLGVATVWPASTGHPSELIRAADRALYRAKRDGRNRVRSASA